MVNVDIGGTPPSAGTVGYATDAALKVWLGLTPDADLPAGAAGLLRSATFFVAAAANRNPYTDTPDAASALVLSDATCAQVQSWLDSGVIPSNPVGSGGVKERAIDTARVVYDTAGQADARAAAVRDICEEARRILQVGGLLALPLPVGADPNDTLATYGLPTTLGGIGFDPFGYEAARDSGYGYGFFG